MSGTKGTKRAINPIKTIILPIVIKNSENDVLMAYSPCNMTLKTAL